MPQFAFDFTRREHGVGRAFPVQRELDGFFDVETRDLDAVAVPAPDGRDVFDAHDAVAGFADDGAPQLVEIVEFVQRANEVNGAEILDGPAGTVDVLLAQRLGQVVERQPQRGQPVLVGLDLDLRIEPAAHLGGGDPGDRLQPRLEPAFGDLPQLVERPVADQRQPHDRIERRVEAQHARTLGLARQLGEPRLVTRLHRRVIHRVGPIELEDHLGHARSRHRVHVAQAGDRPDGLLDRPRDELLDGGRSGVGIGRLDRQRRIRQIRQQFDGQLPGRQQPEDHDRQDGDADGNRPPDGKFRKRHGSSRRRRPCRCRPEPRRSVPRLRRPPLRLRR